MINKRLIRLVDKAKKYIALQVLFQWLSLGANICMILAITSLLGRLLRRDFRSDAVLLTLGISLGSIVVRFVCAVQSAKFSGLASESVKKTLRQKIYGKLLKLGASYHERISTAEAVQVSVEGVEQLEVYFGRYLPQLFYSMLAPVTLFAVLSFVNFKAAAVLLACVPLIPLSIVAVQKFAKKLFSGYWGEYTSLGDGFLENLQGLTTLKIYGADEHISKVMNHRAERFLKITMRVLVMQLNSVTLMDLIAFGGAAAGIIVSVSEYMAGRVSFAGGLAIILLSADFFIPLRLLGSFFHIAMNGMAASAKIFELLDLPVESERKERLDTACPSIECKGLRFSYEPGREILHGLDLYFPPGSLTGLVGESGCGKSTVASLLTGIRKGYGGSILAGEKELSMLSDRSVNQEISLIGHDSYLFKGTVYDNLSMGNPSAAEPQMWEALRLVKLAEFLLSQQGLKTPVAERAANLSGGQRQRLALARALLHDSAVYIFDEATSNIDVESENDIIELIYKIAKEKTVIFISHRLANVAGADNIYVLEEGRVAGSGRHAALLRECGSYASLWESQQKLEQYTKRAVTL